jgi:nucleotide-binding universal stress UspA family protein
MFTSILVPQDGSPVAASILPYVTHLARNLGARMTLLTVLEPAPPSGRRSVETAGQAEAHATLRRLAERCRDAGTEATTLVVTGRAAAEIVRRAHDGHTDLIAMGTRGHSGLRRGLLGSVTDEVVRTSPAPVLVISPRAAERFGGGHHHPKGITVPLDGSALAEGVLPHAEALAKALSLELQLLRVVPSSALVAYAEDGPPVDTVAIQEELEREAAEYLDQVARGVAQRGVKATCLVGRGAPALAIADQLAATPDHLAAICTHGRSGVGRLLIGSVADYVIRSAGVPVLVITRSPAS